jgi:hypothetical protein
MTAFGSRAADHDGIAIAWELKSVNGKTLDLAAAAAAGVRAAGTVRPPGDPAALLARGNVQAGLTVSRAARQAVPVVNEEFLKDLAGLAKRLEEQFGVAAASADGLLGAARRAGRARGGRPTRKRAPPSMRPCSQRSMQALASLERPGPTKATHSAGCFVHTSIRSMDLIERAAADPSREPAAIRERLAEQVAIAR